MIKAVLLVASILTLSAAVLYAQEEITTTTTTAAPACLFENEVWGSADGTKFYFCLPGTDIVIEQSCPSGTFFIRNSTVSGCVPLELMNPNCVYLEEVGPCTGENLKQPQPSKFDTTQYYLCTAEGATPVALTCPEGKAFIKQDGYLGCFEWESWRDIRQCTDDDEATTIPTDTTPTGTAAPVCLYEDQLWGSSADFTKFYFCQPDTGDIIEESCETGTFFVRDAARCGCVPDGITATTVDDVTTSITEPTIPRALFFVGGNLLQSKTT